MKNFSRLLLLLFATMLVMPVVMANPFTCGYETRDCYGPTCAEDSHDYETDMGNCFMFLVYEFTIGIVVGHPLICLYIILALMGMIVLVVVAGIVSGIVGGAVSR